MLTEFESEIEELRKNFNNNYIKNQINLKNTITKMKNTLERINCRFVTI